MRALDVVDAVRAACLAAGEPDPLHEAAALDLHSHPERVWIETRDAGFAVVRGTELALAVAPDRRGRGHGTRLLTAADAETAWSHGDHPAARRLAARHGWRPTRELWVMRRRLGDDDLPVVEASSGVQIRSYRSTDADEVVRVNAAAFADHPEQGSMDATQLADRMSQDWFDPTGLLLAVDGSGRVLGFHWTKQHDAEVGEVYVVAVDPASQGKGLGPLLTSAGLRHLAGRGLTEVILYVEADNRPAQVVYRRLGFIRDASRTQVQYSRAP